MPIKVLIVDDSTFMCQILAKMVAEDSELTVVGIARDGKEALEKVAELQPDVVTLDVQMPNMDGLKCLVALMEQNPVPVIMVSNFTVSGAEPTVQALEYGAVDFVTKTSLNDTEAIFGIQTELIQKIKVAAKIKVSNLKTADTSKVAKPAKTKLDLLPSSISKIELITIGTSTGGPRALHRLLTLFPKDFPLGFIVAQHMPKDFTQVFAKRLNEQCKMEVAEAKTGDQIKPGKILIAPSGHQTQVLRSKNSLVVEVSDQPNLIYKPSVDHLLKSVATACGGNVLSIILTGMGADGAAGMEQLRKLGARTIAEAEESCVVFGMPRVAIERGGAEYIESLPNIFSRIIDILSES